MAKFNQTTHRFEAQKKTSYKQPKNKTSTPEIDFEKEYLPSETDKAMNYIIELIEKIEINTRKT